VLPFLTVDGLDFSSHLRLAPGEGLDPFDADLLEPSFTDPVDLEGPQLLAMVAGAREMQFPVHLNPAKQNMLIGGGAEEESDLDRWAPGFGASFARSQVWTNEGEYSFRGVTTAMGVAGQQGATYKGPDLAGGTYGFPCVDGDIFLFEADVYIDAITGNGTAYLQFNWHTAAGAYISSNTSLTNGTGGAGSSHTGDRGRWYLRATAPPTAELVSCHVVCNEGSPNPPTSTQNILWDNAALYKLSADKQDLHNLIRDVNSTLRNSPGKRLLWQDVDTDAPTRYDIVYARFEAEYSYRRSQKKWGSGVLRVWVRPYGHTGSHRTATTASAVGTGVGVSLTVPAGEVKGDFPAMVQAFVGAPSVTHDTSGRILGLAVVPTGYTWEIPAASITRLLSSASVADSQGLNGHSVLLDGDGVSARVGLSPATMYQGRHRVLAVGRGQGRLVLSDNLGEQVGAAIGSVGKSRLGHQTMDLGVIDVRPLPGMATVTLNLEVDEEISQGFVEFPNNFLGLMINRIMVLPENSLVLSADVPRELVSWANYGDGAYTNTMASFSTGTRCRWSAGRRPGHRTATSPVRR
jgi:hypothetical protein